MRSGQSLGMNSTRRTPHPTRCVLLMRHAHVKLHWNRSPDASRARPDVSCALVTAQVAHKFIKSPENDALRLWNMEWVANEEKCLYIDPLLIFS